MIISVEEWKAVSERSILGAPMSSIEFTALSVGYKLRLQTESTNQSIIGSKEMAFLVSFVREDNSTSGFSGLARGCKTRPYYH